MNPEAYLVNIARGPVVVTDDLLSALRSGVIAGAAIDVTDPEPLPDGHPAWDEPNLLITPHTADTKTMVKRLFSIRLRENVTAYLGEGSWVGEVNPELGY
jgi:phosphoglycerate dehydrogenase-like enzyme